MKRFIAKTGVQTKIMILLPGLFGETKPCNNAKSLMYNDKSEHVKIVSKSYKNYQSNHLITFQLNAWSELVTQSLYISNPGKSSPLVSTPAPSYQQDNAATLLSRAAILIKAPPV